MSTWNKKFNSIQSNYCEKISCQSSWNEEGWMRYRSWTIREILTGREILCCSQEFDNQVRPTDIILGPEKRIRALEISLSKAEFEFHPFLIPKSWFLYTTNTYTIYQLQRNNCFEWKKGNTKNRSKLKLKKLEIYHKTLSEWSQRIKKKCTKH